MSVTVVSAYYQIPSKFQPEIYMNWIHNFIQIPCDLVFFSEGQNLEKIKSMTTRKNVIFIDLKFTDTYFQKAKYRIIWKKHKKMDHESYHTPELYSIWHEKTKFVLRAIKLNPFKSDKFLWVDAGCFREGYQQFINFPKYEL